MNKSEINQGKLIKNGQEKIKIGLAIIVLSPVLGSLLFWFYSNFVGWMISTDKMVAMFLNSCILVMAIFGVAITLVGCNEKSIEQEKQKNKGNT